MKILIARDEAFNFIYKANIDALRQVGDVDFFSPLHDGALPDCDWLYLPGGYPELFAQQLSANTDMLHSIKEYSENGGKVFAECGGFIYLCNEIDGMKMCGVLPLKTTMNDAHLHLGYRQAEWNGLILRGHEFHYSSVIDDGITKDISALRIQCSAKGKPVSTPIYRYKNVIAGYTHWYWADKPETIIKIINYK